MADWTPDRIRALRLRLGKLSQVELAERLGSRQQTVSFWEAGHTTPSRVFVNALDELEAGSAAPAPEDLALYEAAGKLALAAVAFAVAFRAAFRGASQPE